MANGHADELSAVLVALAAWGFVSVVPMLQPGAVGVDFHQHRDATVSPLAREGYDSAHRFAGPDALVGANGHRWWFVVGELAALTLSFLSEPFAYQQVVLNARGLDACSSVGDAPFVLAPPAVCTMASRRRSQGR